MPMLLLLLLSTRQEIRDPSVFVILFPSDTIYESMALLKFLFQCMGTKILLVNLHIRPKETKLSFSYFRNLYNSD